MAHSADFKTALATSRSAVMVNGTNEPQERLQKTNATKHLLSWRIETKEEESGIMRSKTAENQSSRT
jgi:hypothetical protein